MYLDILNADQMRLLPLLKAFSSQFYLAGGTAIALQIGHRKSIDFDLFSAEEIDPERIFRSIRGQGYKVLHTFTQSSDELTVLIDAVKVTFLFYPFPVHTSVRLQDAISMPDLVHLGAMKAYALGRRSRWKDYVDLYFLIKDHVAFKDITTAARIMFENAFNEKLFREQLCYYEDLDYSEAVEFFKPQPNEINETIRNYLTDVATGT